jgi:CubicO group peptidase (beta-lactamase class C family)
VVDVHGTCDARFAALREILAENLDAGRDLGASVAVRIAGESVVDLWGGWSDPEQTQPWTEHTITNVWSSTKTQMTLCALMLVDRGLLDLDAPVARYWPEFAAEGKDGVLVRHLLGHTSGVSGWAQPVTVDDVYDWERSTSMLAAQAPWWEPGTASGYHAMCQGHLVGEVVRRITGVQLGEFFRRQVAEPLGCDFHIGLDPSEFSRVSAVVPPPPPPIDQADIGAANGHGNARSVALAQSAISNGGVAAGVRLLSADAIEEVFRVQADGTDQVLMLPVRFGIGFGLPNDAVPHLPQRRLCYWGGWGGSQVVNDLDNQMTVTYMMNRMDDGLLGDVRGQSLVSAALAAMG